jgi:hypothetical protein
MPTYTNTHPPAHPVLVAFLSGQWA